jgi:adenylosuccinate synthase
MGIGETAGYALDYPRDAPRAGDVRSPGTLRGKLARLRDRLAPGNTADPGAVADVYRAVADRVTLAGDGQLRKLLARGPVVFEGAQGVLLDEWHGFHPYTTWSTTTFANAETLLAENGAHATRLGVTRTYQTRHGPGPFPTEDPALRIAEPHNGDGRWQGPFRAGHLDAVALGYAAAVTGGVHAVALTHLDTAARHAGQLKVCRAYDIDGKVRAALVPGPPRELAAQQRLTAALLRARPRYDSAVPRTAEEWADTVAGLLHARVVVRSAGPAVAGKTWHPRMAVSR